MRINLIAILLFAVSCSSGGVMQVCCSGTGFGSCRLIECDDDTPIDFSECSMEQLQEMLACDCEMYRAIAAEWERADREAVRVLPFDKMAYRRARDEAARFASEARKVEVRVEQIQCEIAQRREGCS